MPVRTPRTPPYRRHKPSGQAVVTLDAKCVFAKQNIAADPPFSRVDLISCRNVLISLASPLQKRIIPTSTTP